MIPIHSFKRPSRQHGAAALAVALLMLFGITLVAFFANRSMIFEQRTSANQYRSTRAFEAAEAGLEWAVARLNDDKKMVVAPSCAISGTLVQSYADRYLPLGSSGFTGLATTAGASTNIRSGCSISATTGATTCSCPTTTAGLALGAAGDARFTVEFIQVAADPWSVRVYSYGCTNQGTYCEPANSSTPDAVAVVSAIYKMKPAFPNAPGAGLVTGAATVTGGNLNVVNLDVASNGITINSGTTVELGSGTNVTTLPGTPGRASVLDNDPSLAALTAADATGDIFFSSFFGETISAYQNNPKTWIITSGSCGTNTRCSPSCGNAASCGTAISTAYNNGYTKFWTDTDVAFSNNLPAVGTLGTATDPIMIASSASVELKANLTAYGMFYAATATVDDLWDYTGSGTAKVYGAFVSRGAFNKGSGTLDLIYDANIFKPENTRGLMVRVPGSWRDKLSDY